MTSVPVLSFLSKGALRMQDRSEVERDVSCSQVRPRGFMEERLDWLGLTAGTGQEGDRRQA